MDFEAEDKESMGESRRDARGTGQNQGTGDEMKIVRERTAMIDKEKMELLNLRKRVQAQREEIKKLREEIDRLKKVVSQGKAD